MKKTLLKVIGVALAIAGTSVGAVDPAGHPDTVTPTARQQMLVASAAGFAPQGTSAGLAHAGSLQLPAGANGTASSSSNGSQIAFSTVTVLVKSPLRVTGAADGQQGGGNLVSVAAVPEPSGGAMLLCGLVVLAFIARRKTQPVAD